MELIYFCVFFIFYIFFLKYRNRQYIKRNLILKNRIIANSSDQKKNIHEIQNLSTNLDYSTKNFNKIKKKHDSMIYEFDLYKEMLVDLQNQNDKLLESETKYNKSYKDLINKNNDSHLSYKKLSRDMDKLANSYKDLYENHKKLNNNFHKISENNNSLEQKYVDLDSELFIYKNAISSNEKNISIRRN